MELLEDGFDIDVVPDGNIEAGDGSCRDTNVNPNCYFPVFSYQFAESTWSHSSDRKKPRKLVSFMVCLCCDLSCKRRTILFVEWEGEVLRFDERILLQTEVEAVEDFSFLTDAPLLA